MYLEIGFNKIRCLVQIWHSVVPDMENSQSQRFRTRPKNEEKRGKKKTMKEGEWIQGRRFQEMQSLSSQLMRS